MNPDISRQTFRADNGYSRVVFQQGRPLVDSDLNEQGSILAHQTRELARAIFGRCCAVDEKAFEISLPAARLSVPIGDAGIDFDIGLGRLYADGILCHNTTIERYGNQFKHGDTTPRVVDAGWWIVYLEMWEKTVTAVMDSALLDAAFGGTDTAARAQVMFRVRVLAEDVKELVVPTAPPPLPKPRPPTDGELFPKLRDVLDQHRRTRTGSAKFRVSPSAKETANSLYRLEVHRVQPGNKAASVKVSRSNASYAFRVHDVSVTATDVLNFTIDAGGFKDAAFPQLDSWVELSTLYDLEKRHVGKLGQITSIGQDGKCQVKSDDLAEAAGFKPDIAFVRPWDGVQQSVKFDPKEKDWTRVSDELEIQLLTEHHQSGDFWMVPVSGLASVTPEAREPDGPAVLRVPLGVIETTGTGEKQQIRAVRSVRQKFQFEQVRKW
jgi:hypothetical protein